MKARKHAKNKTSEKPLLKKSDIYEDLDAGAFDNEELDIHELDYESDAIEAEDDEGEKITFGMSFSPMDGDLGDESEDEGDLPETLIRNKNRYDPSLGTQPSDEPDNDELIEKMRITNEDKAGLGYGSNDYS